MKKIIKSFFVLLLSLSLVIPNNITASATENNDTKSDSNISKSNKRIVSYFPNWAAYNSNLNNLQVSDIPWDKVTHINHAFFEITDNYNIQSTDPTIDFKYSYFKNSPKPDYNKYPQTGYAPDELLGHFREYKYYKELYPDVKVLISIGGWSRSNKFHDLAKSADNRKIFANNLVDFLKKYPFIDGFDLDWEWPGFTRPPSEGGDLGAVGGPEDKENFTLLLKDIRETFNSNNMKNKYLTVAVASTEDKADATNPTDYHQYVDYIGLMTYDFAGPWDNVTGHVSPIYNNPKDTLRKNFNMDTSLKLFSEKYKVPREKLLGGTPFYSKGWGNVSPGNLKNGFFEPGVASMSLGPLGSGGQYTWFGLKKLENKEGWVKYFDDTAKAAFLYNESKKEFISYESEESLQAKVDYINNNNYGGLIIWATSGDDVKNDHPLHTILSKGFLDGEVIVKPLSGSLSVDKALNYGSYTITGKVPANSNSKSYKLYENDKVIKQGAVTSTELTITESFKDKAIGNYNYKLETINENGTASSSILTVSVMDPNIPIDNATSAPTAPVLSHNAWQNNTGNYTVTMNMWWGENGSKWKLYENGKLISTKDLTFNSAKTGQSDTVTFTNKAKGTYVYKAELINSKGTTPSSEITITIN